MSDEPKREANEPSMVYRGRLMYWTFDAPDERTWEELSVTERSRWVMLANGSDDIVKQAPRDPGDPGYERYRGGPRFATPARHA
jgi:hypothetical protein